MTGAFNLGEIRNMLQVEDKTESMGFHRRPLPDEVLRRIFLYIHQLSERNPLLLTSLTKRWRDLAVSLPSLWTAVRINHDRHLSVLAEIISRSKTLPIDIYIRLEAYKYRFSTEYEDAIDTLIAHITRWRSLTIVATNPVLHHIRDRIQGILMPALEHFELIQCDTGPVHHLGPFVFDPSVFTSLRLERTMMYPADASLLVGIKSIELVESSLAMLDEQKLLSLAYPTMEPRPPSMTSVERLVVIASNPVTHGLSYSPAFYPMHLTSVTFARLEAPSMDLVQALSHVYGTALSSPVLQVLEIADIHGHALVMLLAVIRSRSFSALHTLSIAAIDMDGFDDKVMDAFSVVTHLSLARVDAGPILRRLADPVWWPALSRMELDGVVVARPTAAR
ncbi:hypothetical protein B0H10DRAFT_2009232 [Mycena sp. CBHHK59/15]|nr:hypothetical protein B0H10DRAFT_2009232 [Mycena sp. CBHHK59/15]